MPEGPIQGPLRQLREILSYSLLADAVLRRTTPGWWRGRIFKRVHAKGEQVCVELLARLERTMKARGGRFLAVAFGTNRRTRTYFRLPLVINGARQQGVDVLDLATETEQLSSDQLSPPYGSGGHFSPEGNKWAADRISAYLTH